MKTYLGLFLLCFLLNNARAEYTYQSAALQFNSLPEGKVVDGLGKWKMVRYAHSKSNTVVGAYSGLIVEGYGPLAGEYRRVLDISFKKMFYFYFTTFKVINTNESSQNEMRFNYINTLFSPLPAPETTRRKPLHCKPIIYRGITRALLCQQRGISSGSVYMSCFKPINSMNDKWCR